MNEVNQKAVRAIETISTLQNYFPIAFPDQASSQLKPLSIGVDKQIFQEMESKGEPISRSAIRLALKRWCRRSDYLKSIVRSSHRIDLFGNSCDLISEGEKQTAKKQLAGVAKKPGDRKAKA